MNFSLIMWVFLRAEICVRHRSMHGRDSTATGVVLGLSADNGSMLDISNKNLVEVTQAAGAEELADLGMGGSAAFSGSSECFHYTIYSIHCPYFMQNCTCTRPSLFTPYNILFILAPPLPNSSFKLVCGFARSSKYLCLSTLNELRREIITECGDLEDEAAEEKVVKAK